MANHHPHACESNATRDDANEVQFDYTSYDGSGVGEPMTPPASTHASVLYTSNPYLLTSKPMGLSPNLVLRKQVPHNYSSMGSSSLASPVDTPLYNTYASQQPAYLATPHTPLASGAQDKASVPTTPSASRPLGMSGRPVASATQASSAVPGIGPLGHTRSYSYNLRDRQHSLSRTSMASNPASAPGSQEREFRPRAYSSGIASSTVPLSGSLGNSAFNQPAIEISTSHHPFPPPLSSPVSPENLAALNGRLGHRPQQQYSNTFAPVLADEQQIPTSGNIGSAHDVGTASGGNGVAPGPPSGFASGPTSGPISGHASGHASGPVSGSTAGTTPRASLHRSLSAMSSLSQPGLMRGSLAGQQLQPAVQYEDAPPTRSLSSANMSLNAGKRSSPPPSRGHRQRRSSSGASSALDITISPGGNAGVATNAPVMPTAPKGATNPLDELFQEDEQQIYSLCKDQRGCRYLQRKLGDHNPQTVRRIFSATYQHIVALMMDPFGNYLCQKLFECCMPDEITEILQVAAPSLATIAVNQHGTRALQKLIDAVSKPEQVEILVNSLDGHVVRLIRDLNGNHVIQKLLLDLDGDGSQFIYDAVCNSVVEIGSHRHGCCVLQRCLDYAQDQTRNRLVAHIVAKALILVCDPFGNYVCQYVIDLGVQDYTDALVQQLLGQISSLSVQKFSSNVVEKCLRCASPDLQKSLVSEIMTPKTLHELLLDNYGNYVIQTALESSSSMDAASKEQLAESIQSALTTTRSPYGRRVMSKLKSW